MRKLRFPHTRRQDRTRTRSRAHAHRKLGLMRFYATTRANDNDLSFHERTEIEDILAYHTCTHTHAHTYTYSSIYICS